jgi:hypothetical protein
MTRQEEIDYLRHAIKCERLQRREHVAQTFETMLRNLLAGCTRADFGLFDDNRQLDLMDRRDI